MSQPRVWFVGLINTTKMTLLAYNYIISNEYLDAWAASVPGRITTLGLFSKSTLFAWSTVAATDPEGKV